jgi:hypothetical protein
MFFGNDTQMSEYSGERIATRSAFEENRTEEGVANEITSQRKIMFVG